jgi:FtsZ-interacting cell division protein ZipA
MAVIMIIVAGAWRRRMTVASSHGQSASAKQELSVDENRTVMDDEAKDDVKWKFSTELTEGNED